MKVSNAAEDPATLDMEALAVLHAARVDPGLPLAIPWRLAGAAGDHRTRARAGRTFEHGDGAHHVRLYDVLPGSRPHRPADLPDAALVGWGETTARLGRALRGFFHPAAQRTMLWDVQHAAADPRDLIPTIRDAGPARPRRARPRPLRRGRRAGVAVAARPGRPRRPDHRQRAHRRRRADHRHRRLRRHEPLGARRSTSRRVLDSLRRPTEASTSCSGPPASSSTATSGSPRSSRVELRLLGELLATRAAVTIAISSWRSAAGPGGRRRSPSATTARSPRTIGDPPGPRLGRGRAPDRRGGRRRSDRR